VAREAAALGVKLADVRVTAAGGFGTGTWRSNRHQLCGGG